VGSWFWSVERANNREIEAERGACGRRCALQGLMLASGDLLS
jgi:hypothetical protein